jgi:hypothetical protein
MLVGRADFALARCLGLLWDFRFLSRWRCRGFVGIARVGRELIAVIRIAVRNRLNACAVGANQITVAVRCLEAVRPLRELRLVFCLCGERTRNRCTRERSAQQLHHRAPRNTRRKHPG